MARLVKWCRPMWPTDDDETRAELSDLDKRMTRMERRVANLQKRVRVIQHQ